MTKPVGEVQESITRIELDNGISAGIHWRVLGPDLVPIFEEHEARLERNIGLKDWYAMDSMERAMVIAVRRLQIATKNQQTEAEIRAANRRAKKGSR